MVAPTSEESSFLDAMLDNPADKLLRLVFADWLEERGDLRGELLRLTHALTQSIDIPNRPELESRLQTLLAEDVQPIGPFWTNSLGMKFAWIPAGIFLMGSPPNEEKRIDDEIQHKVTLTKGFYLGVYLVTQEQWQAVMGDNPSHFTGKKNLPVEQVSWETCQQFANNLQKQDKRPYRLPTEAEWEYACRAGTTTPFHFGDAIFSDQANYYRNYMYGNDLKGSDREMLATVDIFPEKTTPVGIFPANAWGLHDMHANLWEWCQDWYEDYPQKDMLDPQGPNVGEARVVRGGSWNNFPKDCRAASRGMYELGDRFDSVGFRVCFHLD